MKKHLHKMWDSPTVTTWGNHLVESLRLLAVTPLLLTKFDATEIAAWYLFGTLLMLGNTVFGRLGPTFIRMIAFAMGGAKSLAPIKTGDKPSTDGISNWEMVKRSYGTLGVLSLGLAVASLLLGLGLGYAPLAKLAATHDAPLELWLGFGIMLSSGFLLLCFQSIMVALQGMNYVALVNRWSMIFSLLSIVAGSIALTMGANLWQLALVMQLCQLINLIRLRITLGWVAEKRFRQYRFLAWDTEIFSWSWAPMWRIMLLGFSGAAILQLASVVYVQAVTVEQAASFLFTLKILFAVRKVSDAPFQSHTPRMARLLAQGELGGLRRTVTSKIQQQQVLYSLGIMGLLTVGPPLLSLIGSNTSLLSPTEMIVFGLCFQFQNYIVSHLLVSQLGNHVICFLRQLLVGLISVGLIYLLIPIYGFWGVIFAVFLPFVLLINVYPIQIALVRLEGKWFDHLWKTGAASLALWVVVLLLNAFSLFPEETPAAESFSGMKLKTTQYELRS